MKKSNLFLFLFLTFGILWACVKEENKIPFQFYWDQTGCADPWENSGSGTQALSFAVEEYLSEQEIIGARVLKITQEAPRQDCFACHCTTGTRIFVEVPFQFWEKMEELGFRKR